MEGFTGTGCVYTGEEVLTATLSTGTVISVVTIRTAVTTKILSFDSNVYYSNTKARFMNPIS